MEDEIIKIQEVLSHQGNEINELSDVLYAQQKEIAALHNYVEKLKSEMENIKYESKNPDHKPPHY